ncbi:uncharacterized protein LOC126175514 isoform X6 [Schistocerca cancellata]|uniref:uncharacterized protein LOC126175514 isoform X6 n=1 Tax=Schistocerca cancellata TaxID=274614 RepID=UPI0021177B62|nr:uncharacterized protein LOC126175514 isoform X6 [Schistocerca cancellata]
MEGTSNTTQPSDLKAQHRRFFKLRVCPHLEQAKELKFLSSNLLSYCKDLANEGTDMSTESYGTVTFAQVTKDADPMTEAVTLKTAYTYSAQSAVTSLKPEMGAAYNISDTELGLLLCQNFHLIDNSVSFIARRTLGLYCKVMNFTDTGTSTAATTEVTSARKLTTTAAAGTSEGPFDTSRVPDAEQAATSLTQQEEPSSHISSLTKLREVCRHLNQVKNKMFGPFLQGLCKHVGEPDTETSTAATTEVMSARKLTTTAAAGTSEGPFDTSRVPDAEQAATSLTQQEEPSSHISSLTKLREVCRHLNHVKNKMFGPYLPGLCKHVDEPDTDLSAESIGTVTATLVIKDADAITEAVTAVTLNTANTYGAQSAVTSVEPETGVTYNISDTELGLLVCQNFHLIDNSVSFIARRTLGLYCKIMNPTDTDLSAESIGTVTATLVTKDADAITEAVTAVTLNTANTYGAQSAVTSVEPETGVTYNISDTELGLFVCQNFHLIDNSVSFIARRTLGLYCKIMNPTDTGTSTAATTEVMSARKLTTTAAAGTSEGPFDTSRVPDAEQAATSLSQQEEPSSHISSLTKLREVCRHLNQVKNKMFGPFLPGLCKHVDEPGSTPQPCKLMTSSPSGEPIKESNDESVDEAGDESTDEAAQPTTLLTDTRRHESIDESINKSYEECGLELYDDIVTY